MTEPHEPPGPLPEPICRLDDLLCGCGCPELVWGLFAEILLSCRERTYFDCGEDGGKWLAVYLLDHHELTEHGTSVGGAWLTEDGELAQQFLEDNPRWFDEEWIDAEGVTRGFFA